MGDLVTCTITSSPIFTFRRESEFAAAASAGHIARVQIAVFRLPETDERRLHSVEHVHDPSLVNVARNFALVPRHRDETRRVRPLRSAPRNSRRRSSQSTYSSSSIKNPRAPRAPLKLNKTKGAYPYRALPSIILTHKYTLCKSKIKKARKIGAFFDQTGLFRHSERGA